MKIWKIYTSEENNICLTAEEQEYEKLYPYFFEGEKIKDNWDESLQLIVDKRKKYDYNSDFLSFSDSYFVVSERALKLFECIAKEDYECLNFRCEEGKYFIINICTVIDCIDMDKSIYQTYKKNPEKILRYKKLFFKQEEIKDKKIFIAKHHEGGLIVCTDEFKDAVEENELYGVRFELLDECN